MMKDTRKIFFLIIGCIIGTAAWWPASAALTPDQVPRFHLRFRVTKQNLVTQNFALNGLKEMPMQSVGNQWSDWVKFGTLQAEQVLKGYPNLYLKRFPVVIKLRLSGKVDFPVTVNAEIKWDKTGEVVPLTENLSGSVFGIMLWINSNGEPHAGSMADYNRLMIWDKIQSKPLDASEIPQKFPLVDRFIGGSNDSNEWRDGVNNLSKYGFNSIMLPASSAIRDLLQETVVHRTASAIYNPPGYAFEFTLKDKEKGDGSQTTPQILDAWAKKLAKPYSDAGYDLHDISLYNMSDEPGWYYPATIQSLQKDAAGMARFHQYLKDQHLRPSDLGTTDWNAVQPIGVSAAVDLPHRRLFYWTMRFMSWDSARHFANSTRAMEKAFYQGIPNPVNWNFFSGRFYVPGPVANNRDKSSPDAAMGGHDWFEFARMHGSTMLWTEDWFGDNQAYQWSYYAAKLGPAARRADSRWGAYVIPRASGQTEFGLMQKVLSVIGNGGKAVEYFTFGPEYNFPGNCYSTRADVLLPKLAQVHRMIAKAEDVLWPGQKPQAQVAILQPRSSELWDSNGISDATNTNMNRATVDYMAEVYDLYRGLQQQNIPADFVSEGELTPAGLKGYKVLFVTEPNFPREWIRGLSKWVNDGGVLVSVSGAFTSDRYNDPMSDFQEVRGITEKQRPRLMVPDADKLPKSGAIDGWSIYGVKGQIIQPGGEVTANFDDGSPAIIERKSGKGAYIHYAFLPGISAYVSRDKKSGFFPEAALKWIAFPVHQAAVQTPVSVDQLNVETPLLLSPDGAAVTLLNWRKEDLSRLNVTVHPPFAVKSVESVTTGKIPFVQKGGAVTFPMPLKGADIVMLKK